MVKLFHTYVEEEDNDDLMAKVSEIELLEGLCYFQKDESPSPNGCPIEFYLGVYDILGKDLLKMVEESIMDGHIHAPLNTIFISIIP
jgi:hypothetical protein